MPRSIVYIGIVSIAHSNNSAKPRKLFIQVSYLSNLYNCIKIAGYALWLCKQNFFSSRENRRKGWKTESEPAEASKNIETKETKDMYLMV